MTITRVRPHHPGRQAHRRRHPRPGQRAGHWVWNFHRKHAGGSGMKNSSPGEVFRES